MGSVCLPRHPAVAYLLLVRRKAYVTHSGLTCFRKKYTAGTMKPAILTAALLAALPVITAAQNTDEMKRNADVARHFFDRSNANDISGMLSDLAEDAKNFGRSVGRDGFRHVLEDIFTTFPDWHVEIVDMVTEGDSVVMRCKVSGTHRGIGKIPVNGGMLVGVAPTGRHFETDHIHWFKFRDGKILDHYATRDDISMMRQLGLIPPVASPSPSASPR